MVTDKEITDNDLHAYIDGFLDPNDIERVEAWLAHHPNEAAKVHAYRVQNRKIQQAFSPTLQEDIPSEMLDAIYGKRQNVSGFFMAWRQIAASLLLLLIGAAGGWSLNVQLNKSPDGHDVVAFVDQAVGAHRVFVSEVRHPVEVPASQEGHLVAWLSKRIGTSLSVPDLQSTGFGLVGGRLLADASIPAAQFMYEDESGKRLTLYVRATDETEDTSFRFETQNGTSAFYWIDDQFAYAMIAHIERNVLLPIANQVYQQFNAKP